MAWMTQSSDSCGRVHSRSVLKVPFPRLKRVCLGRECNSNVRFTLARNLVAIEDELSKQMLETKLRPRSVVGLLLELL